MTYMYTYMYHVHVHFCLRCWSLPISRFWCGPGTAWANAKNVSTGGPSTQGMRGKGPCARHQTAPRFDHPSPHHPYYWRGKILHMYFWGVDSRKDWFQTKFKNVLGGIFWEYLPLYFNSTTDKLRLDFCAVTLQLLCGVDFSCVLVETRPVQKKPKEVKSTSQHRCEEHCGSQSGQVVVSWFILSSRAEYLKRQDVL